LKKARKAANDISISQKERFWKVDEATVTGI